jgi:hypothetical protein
MTKFIVIISLVSLKHDVSEMRNCLCHHVQSSLDQSVALSPDNSGSAVKTYELRETAHTSVR